LGADVPVNFIVSCGKLMSDINSIDLRGIVSSVIINTFETMLDMRIEAIESEATLSWPRFVSQVGVAGSSVIGNICINLDMKGASMIAGAMLGAEEDELEISEIDDVVGELSNIAGGSIKSSLCDDGFICRLSIPSVTYGSDFKFDTVGFDRGERLWFKCQELVFFVEIFIKAT